MRRCWSRLMTLCLLLGTSAPARSQVIQFYRYHSLADAIGYMRDFAGSHSWATYESLGNSREGRPIPVLIMTKSPTYNVPALVINGAHHGDELSSVEGVLAVIDHLGRNSRKPEVDALLRRYVVIAQPIVNPDGHARRTRGDSRGADLNRDYEWPTSSSGAAFRAPETRAVATLSGRFTIKGALALHGGMQSVLWPWCYTGGATDVASTFAALAKQVGTAMGYSDTKQSYYDYPTTGEYIDYAFMKDKTWALTVEVSNNKIPPIDQIPMYNAKVIAGFMALAAGVRAHDAGLLRPENPNPALWTFNSLFTRLGQRLE